MERDTADELEQFRQQWQQEVTARSKAPSSAPTAKSPHPSHHGGAFVRRAPSPVPQTPVGVPDETPDESAQHGDHASDLSQTDGDDHATARQEPNSALEHYERAVEREDEGSLGDSLSHYRKAFRLDAGVDRIYKNKHFPSSSSTSKPLQPNPSNAPVTVPNPAHHSLDGPPGQLTASSISQLIASFSNLTIPVEEPPTDLSPPIPCPISTIPSEILINILLQTAISDVASFARLSVVCKRLAYLTSTEDRIWRHICYSTSNGFAGMHYTWAVTITGSPLPTSISDHDTSLSLPTLPPTLPLTPSHPTYRQMFHTRPRLRFNGCYISTVNYIRPGAATASQATWNSPVLIVTYYRYLRFFREGTCVSLLTTTEPADAVHHLTKENLHVRHAPGLPSAVMNYALRGRWKLSGNPYTDNESPEGKEPQLEGMLHIETEGADAGTPNPKYVYKMMLQLKSVKRGAGATQNNKLAWVGYWSYNKLTDDWAEFGLRNDQAFVWSRVRSWEVGG